IIPSYIWIAIVIGLAWIIFLSLKIFFIDIYYLIIPPTYEFDILALSLLNALMLTNYNFLLGRKRIGVYNVIFTIQILTLFLTLIYRMYIIKEVSVDAWVYSVFCAYGIGFVLSFIAVISKIGSLKLQGTIKVIKQVFYYGLVTQLANILHIANKRISVYFLKAFTGLSSVGVYGAGIQLTEGLRLIGQSISLVQFTEISNSNDKEFAVNITIKLMKFSVLLTSFAVLILLIIPTNVYSLIFGSDFNDLKYVIIALSPGVIALSSNTIFSHYFSGLGRPSISLWANGIGFVVTLAFAILLIPFFGFIGAAATASASYISSVIYQYVIFKKETGTKLEQWLPVKNDFLDFFKILNNLKKVK
ncbi:MAG: polysaccharide biosynthesis C-terminal domain-containing protein, partial [Bacteroidetes bacterium]|nr:polysaccharide biosynthesis C-terminal domain-containing protein [Bacteroidota bacterium]